MKIKNHFNQSTIKRVAAAIGIPVIAVGLATFPANAQNVKIEGGPGAVQISDNDGKVEASTPLNNPVGENGVPTVPRIPGANAAPVPSSPSTEVSAEDLVAPVQPKRDPVSRDAVDAKVKLRPNESRDRVTGDVDASATATVPAIQPQMNANDMKRMAELRRELNIADSATVAALSFKSDDLFTGENATIETLAAPTLEKVAEYIALGNKKNVTVRSYYVPGEGTKETAWDRSLALIDWMKENTAIELENIRAIGPGMATAPVPKENATDVNSTELVSMIEVEIR